MADDFKNKIKRLELENFTCFSKVVMDFSPGINVFIGENGTGKTHLLKVLYSRSINSVDSISKTILERIFKVYDESELLKHGTSNSSIIVFFDDQISMISIDNVPNETGSYLEESIVTYVNSKRLFLPTLEMLSWFKGFISSYEKRENFIDETYYQLAKALDPLPLKGIELQKQISILKNLEETIKGKVIRRGDEFFIKFENDSMAQPAPLIATGINKIAQLIYLIMNGSLTKDTILFWDEPEANLNPKYILIVAKFLQTLANAGCQIFVATHDYLLPYELSLSKEYANVAEGNVPEMKFFALYKGENGTEVEEGETMPDLRHDAIHEGVSSHNMREKMLFQKSLTEES